MLMSASFIFGKSPSPDESCPLQSVLKKGGECIVELSIPTAMNPTDPPRSLSPFPLGESFFEIGTLPFSPQSAATAFFQKIPSPGFPFPKISPEGAKSGLKGTEGTLV